MNFSLDVAHNLNTLNYPAHFSNEILWEKSLGKIVKCLFLFIFYEANMKSCLLRLMCQ